MHWQGAGWAATAAVCITDATYTVRVAPNVLQASPCVGHTYAIHNGTLLRAPPVTGVFPLAFFLLMPPATRSPWLDMALQPAAATYGSVQYGEMFR